MSADGIRLLVKVAPGASEARLGLGARDVSLRLQPLFHSIAPSPAPGLGLRAAPVWHLATSQERDVNPWDACHRLMRQGLGFAGGEVAIAEPDVAQEWRWEPKVRPALGLADDCAAAAKQNGKDYAPFPDGERFDSDTFTQLASARQAVGVPAFGNSVRIAHCDTGYDPAHRTLPRHLRLDLQRNFVDDERPYDATDKPTSILNPMFGHGTGTLGILAGNAWAGAPDGGAANLEIVPIRVANWVTLIRNSAIAQAFDYVHHLWGDPAKRVHVITMSMGGLPSAAWTDAVNALYERGVVVVTAAGNSYGNVPPYIVYPGRYRRVIAACGVMANGKPYADLGLTKMSGSYGPDSKMRTAMAAYTPNIPWAKNGCPEIVDLDGGGTSAATPQIAAAAALWLQQHKAAVDAYPEGWMRVEAARAALFGSAMGTADSKHLGRGLLRAHAALSDAPRAAATLQKEKEDSASFALVRLVTGLGIAAPESTQAMLELEALQIVQQSAEIGRLLDGSDPDDPALVGTEKGRAVLEALADHPGASETLQQAIRGRLGPKPKPATAVAPVPQPPRPWTPEDTARVLQPQIRRPTYRALRVFAFDPSFGTRLDTLNFNEATLKVPWEDNLAAGPIGEYLEVVDVDPGNGCAYAPVNLNHPEVLAQDGLPPSDGSPQFHQQMVYAVAMKTIRHFEHALGRKALWAERRASVDGDWNSRFVRRLRIYPHALQEPNAFYSPDKRALLFGYFRASQEDAGANLPGGMIFTCLSHDIVAHEATHALLDGLHPRFKEGTNPDMLAFHEAFADIVALFQHFTLPEALRDQIARTRADLAAADLLAGLALQFGEAIKYRGHLRSAIAQAAPGGEPQRVKPTQADYLAKINKPHEHGSVLVAAVFDAFAQIYRRKTEDLVRLATGGTGILPQGRPPHDLIERLASEASRIAGHVLDICIRALDYCPPVDLTFGEYLRALITADRDVAPEDEGSYRVAFVQAFRARGIFPADVLSLSVDALLWQPPEIRVATIEEAVRGLRAAAYKSWDMKADRYEAYESANANAKELYWALVSPALSHDAIGCLGLHRTDAMLRDHGDEKKQPRRTKTTIDGLPGWVSPMEIHSVRPSRRVGPGEVTTDMVIEVTQRWYPDDDTGRFYRGGCTIICDLGTGQVRYVIRKRIGKADRVESQRQFGFSSDGIGLHGNYFKGGDSEPFALMHRHE